MHYFGRWEAPQGALAAYQAFLNSKPLTPPPDASHSPDTSAVPLAERPDKPYEDFPLFPQVKFRRVGSTLAAVVITGRQIDARVCMAMLRARRELLSELALVRQIHALAVIRHPCSSSR